MKVLIIGMMMAMVCSFMGCTSNPNAERNKRPNYVSMSTGMLKNSNGIMWDVNCGDFEVSVADREFDDFYNEDGTQMTQREYCDFIADAKREETKLKRLDKVIPMILKSIGLNDKYR